MVVFFRLQVEQKNRKPYKELKTDVLNKIRIIEKDLQFDAAALFNRKAKSSADFVEFFRGSLHETYFKDHLSVFGFKAFTNRHFRPSVQGLDELAWQTDKGIVLAGEGIDRHYYELCALSELKNSLRSGDMWVEGSRQFKDFEEYLLPANTFNILRSAGTLPLDINIDCDQNFGGWAIIAYKNQSIHGFF